MKRVLLSIVATMIMVMILSVFVFAEDMELTIYNQNFGLVKDRRTLTLKKGINDTSFSDVAVYIEPTSVHFKSLTDPSGCVIQEQNYEYDLINSSKLLSKYIDKKIKIATQDNKGYEGTLMSYDADSIVVTAADSTINMISRKDNIRDISFPELPEGLITKPTLMWQISNDKPGNHLIEVSYLTGGITWNADYVVVVDKDDLHIDLSGWVTVDNKSGATYKDAALKLIAGDVHRAEEGRGARLGRMMYEKVAAAPQFKEKSFFEYHMYTLQRKTTVKDNQMKQISLLSASDIPVKKLFIYDPVDYFGWRWFDYENQQPKEQKVKVKIELKNSKQNNLGMPLPKGKIKVYQKDTDGSLQFIGEDIIDHTPKDEIIRLYLGDAFDVIGERRKINYRVGDKWAEESFEISLRNHKDTNVEVNVIEHMWRYANWKITDKSQDFTKKDTQTIEFRVAVPKDGETKVTYTVRYWW